MFQTTNQMTCPWKKCWKPLDMDLWLIPSTNGKFGGSYCYIKIDHIDDIISCLSCWCVHEILRFFFIHVQFIETESTSFNWYVYVKLIKRSMSGTWIQCLRIPKLRNLCADRPTKSVDFKSSRISQEVPLFKGHTGICQELRSLRVQHPQHIIYWPSTYRWSIAYL